MMIIANNNDQEEEQEEQKSSGDFLIHSPTRYESTFKVAGDVTMTGGTEKSPVLPAALSINKAVPSPYLDIMSVAYKVNPYSKEAPSYQRLFVEPMAIPDLSHTGITTTLIDAESNDEERITYPNGWKRSNLEDLLRVELRGALYESTGEFRQEDLDDAPGTGLYSPTAFTSSSSSTYHATASKASSRRMSHLRNISKKSRKGRKKSTSARSRSRASLPAVSPRGRGLTPLKSTTTKKTLQRLIMPETSPFWRKPNDPEPVKRREKQAQSLLRNLRSFGHALDVRK